MTTIYEWTCEIVSVEETSQYGIGDVVDSTRFDTAKELKEYIMSNADYDSSIKLVPVVVRLDNGWHSWAYLDGEIPTHFYDSNAEDVAKMPKKILREWVSA